MFTGIVESLGEVLDVQHRSDSAQLRIRGAVIAGSAVGESVAVNGVCLTVVDVAGDTFGTDVVAETLRRTTLSALAAGDRVNLERAATLQTRLGGHLVQGHVDGVGRVVGRTTTDAGATVSVELPAALSRYVVEKGSITLDGVSLTVATVDDATVTVALIPETLRRTTWGTRQVGDAVNVEVDVLAKYVERLFEARTVTS